MFSLQSHKEKCYCSKMIKQGKLDFLRFLFYCLFHFSVPLLYDRSQCCYEVLNKIVFKLKVLKVMLFCCYFLAMSRWVFGENSCLFVMLIFVYCYMLLELTVWEIINFLTCVVFYIVLHGLYCILHSEDLCKVNKR